MKRGLFCLLLLMVLGTGHAADGLPQFGVGDRLPDFTMASTQGLFDYADQIYGSHHLILTFFPAAFTPV